MIDRVAFGIFGLEVKIIGCEYRLDAFYVASHESHKHGRVTETIVALYARYILAQLFFIQLLGVLFLIAQKMRNKFIALIK